MKAIVKLLLCVASIFCVLAVSAYAQGTSATPQPLTVSATDETSLRAMLAEPMAQDLAGADLQRVLRNRLDAVERLGDPSLKRSFLTDAMAREPKVARWRNDMAWLESDAGNSAESERLFKLAISLATNAPARLFFQVGWAQTLARTYANAEAQAIGDAVRSDAQALLGERTSDSDRYSLLRVMMQVERLDAEQQHRRGRSMDRLAAQMAAQRHAVNASVIAQRLANLSLILSANHDLAAQQKYVATALVEVGRFREADAELTAHRKFVTEKRLGLGWEIGAYSAVARLHYAERDFVAAETALRAEMSLHARTRAHVGTTLIVDDTGLLAACLWAVGRSVDAVPVLDSLKDLELGNEGLAQRAKLPFERGLVLLGENQPDQAVSLFAESARRMANAWGSGHYLTAQSEGLRGVALWRSADPVQRDAAIDVLRRAATSILAARNAGFPVDRGVRPLTRLLILNAYVEAAAARGGVHGLLALGVADGLRPGLTPQALADSALRGAGGDPKFAALVREDQDARNEAQAAQASLAQTGAEALPGAAADTLRSRMSALEQRRGQLRIQIRDLYPNYEQLLTPPLADTASVANQLAPDEAMIVLLPTPQAVLVWSVTPDELPRFLRIDWPSAQVKTIVGRIRRSVELDGGPPRRFDVEAAHEIYTRLLAPLAPTWRRTRHLIIAASGELGSVPFASLVIDVPRAGSNAPTWLIQHWSVSQVPSIGSWMAIRAVPSVKPAPEALLAWGDPVFGSRTKTQSSSQQAIRQLPPAGTNLRVSELPALPETRAELRAIASTLNADATRDLMLGREATRDSVLAASRSGLLGRKRVVAFATHGLMGGELPGLTQPALVLSSADSNAPGISALLTLDDVFGLHMNADWVVLSACNTAAGDGRGEEAMSGLARAFLYAGSRSVLVTQWAVDSDSAAKLTTRIFAHQSEHPSTAKAESLRQSMLSLAAEPRYAHPAFWAPFTLVGDGR